MRIDEIAIKHFRGFDQQKTFTFDPEVNVILGNNTTGKTTLLHAVQIALGAYLQELTLASGCSRNFKKTDHVSKYSALTRRFLPSEYKPEISVKAHVDECTFDLVHHVYETDEAEISWTRTSSRNSYRSAGQLMEFVASMERSRRSADETGITSVLPLMLSFGADRLESASYNGAEKTRVRASREEKAYKCALDEKVDFKSAFDWIYRYEKELDREHEFEGTDRAFLNALYEAIPALKQIEIDRKNSEFTAQIQMTDDVAPYWLTYDMMSAGFKAMINIVAEVAHRCIELNGFLGEDAVKKTPGIVMIDEIDLYLHPHWQQHVLLDLQTAFPKMQFIVTTHSPFIVQSVESHNVITLDGVRGDNHPTMRSIEDIAVTEMNMDTARFPKYQQMVDAAERYYQLVRAGHGDTVEATIAKAELDSIEEQFSDDPAYVALLRAERRSQ